ncbi:MAG TPA: PrsW family glutamic-type intramembrane protease [Bacteroidales bacterium]|nr:PrsW family glutamic-type intramembrane protease [Bacteroidales bacterium]HPI86202.1 PrsW family glutamic-type intramembrane protease [Bacteroidales bacterium]HPM92914.1 PrsW family glutamic-type intramembrane protease [Bacteroidales bacterium]
MVIYIATFVITIIFWLWIIRKFDRFEREPLKNILFVFIAGGLLSIIPAGLFNGLFAWMIGYGFEPGSDAGIGFGRLLWFYGFVGFNEEFWKALATIILIRRMKSFNEPADALVYSMTVAFGFSVIENIEYTLKLGYPVFWVRQFNAVPLHVGLAAIWGIGIAKVRFSNAPSYLSRVMPYILIAAFLHFIYNIAATRIFNTALSLLIPTVIAFFLILFAIRRVKKYSEEGPFRDGLGDGVSDA